MSQAGPEKSRVVSRDGTEIAYWTSGDGPPLLLVHGTAGVHDRFDLLRPFLEPHGSVNAMDRRGRGGSGDAPDYALEREHEDVAAVVEAIAAASGTPVAVYGHSFGGNCVFGATALTQNIRALVLYEGWPPVRPKLAAVPPETLERLDALVAAGEREAALELFMRAVAQVPEDEIAAIRAQPTWPARVAAAHTITREVRAFAANPFDAGAAKMISVPVLVLVGSDTPDAVRDDPEAVVAALPDARLVAIEGQQHLADVLVPDAVAAHVLDFLRETA